MKFTSVLAASLPISALAGPIIYSNYELPRDAVRLALDERNNHLLAFDMEGRSLGAYPVTLNNGTRTPLKRGDPITSATASCVRMEDKDIGGIPGIQKLRDEADKNWGNGKRREVVNDKDLLDRPASVCAEDKGTIVPEGDPECHVTNTDAQGGLEDGKYTLKHIEKLETTEKTETTKTTSWGMDATMSASFGIEGIADMSVSTTFKTEVTNAQSKAQQVTHTEQIEQTIEQPVDASEKDTCKVSFQSKTCTTHGKGSLRMVSTGFLWFEYEDRTHDHYKWALKIDDVLPDVKDRSQTIELKHTRDTSSSSHFHAEGCKKEAVIKDEQKK